MSITLQDLDFLVSDRGDRLLHELSLLDLAPRHTLTVLTRLRKTYRPEEAAAALALARLRQKAVDKFGADASRMFFSEDALQQASDPAIRAYRQQFAIQQKLLDVCCGIGSDSLSFAQGGAQVLGLDYDEVRIAMAQLNAQALAIPAQFQLQDVMQGIPSEFPVIFFDPARRDEQGKRIHHVDRYIPPLDLIHNWHFERIMVKLSPGVQLDEVAAYGGMVEFISVRGDLKEAVLHCGADDTGMRATLLDQGHVLHWDHPGSEPQITLAEPGGWLCEPDPALLRAGLVRHVAAQSGGWLLDDTIAYFCAHTAPDTRWVRSWKILDWMPFQVKRLRAYLRERQIGRVTIKKRGSAITPDELIPMLKLQGNRTCTLVLTRLQETPIVIICEDIA